MGLFTIAVEKQYMQALKSCMSNDGYRKALQCVQVDEMEDGTRKLVTTDTHRLLVLYAAGCGQLPSGLYELVSIGPKETVLRSVEDVQFPNYERVVPKDEELTEIGSYCADYSGNLLRVRDSLYLNMKYLPTISGRYTVYSKNIGAGYIYRFDNCCCQYTVMSLSVE